MVPEADKIGSGATARDDPRFIRGAKVLRNTKIDEMPQFLSVLAGQLSLVGPRPELRQYVDLYTPEDREIIMSVKPGIFDFGTLEFTNLQAHLGDGDAEAVFLEKFAARKIALRRKYVEEMGFWTDLTILLKTPVHIVGSLLKR
jgi:lipopolysaccharide/colanic/teichoic acid biosynthesis glycosyltransferase